MRVSFRLGDPDPSVTPTESQPELKTRLLGTGHFSRAWARQSAALLCIVRKRVCEEMRAHTSKSKDRI